MLNSLLLRPLRRIVLQGDDACHAWIGKYHLQETAAPIRHAGTPQL
jgi:hypothetical protein